MLKIWRPRKWKNPEDLIEVINEYFTKTPLEEVTVTGLCLAIGTSRTVMNDYEEREWFKEIISEAKLLIENSYELSLRKNGRTGDIFALKNFWWKDKTEQETKTEWSIEIKWQS